jgi:hypothetical protein
LLRISSLSERVRYRKSPVVIPIPYRAAALLKLGCEMLVVILKKLE